MKFIEFFSAFQTIMNNHCLFLLVETCLNIILSLSCLITYLCFTINLNWLVKQKRYKPKLYEKKIYNHNYALVNFQSDIL
jgi:hypothetical protein